MHLPGSKLAYQRTEYAEDAKFQRTLGYFLLHHKIASCTWENIHPYEHKLFVSCRTQMHKYTNASTSSHYQKILYFLSKLSTVLLYTLYVCCFALALICDTTYACNDRSQRPEQSVVLITSRLSHALTMASARSYYSRYQYIQPVRTLAPLLQTLSACPHPFQMGIFLLFIGTALVLFLLGAARRSALLFLMHN